MSRWLRWYAGTSEDAKFRLVARNASVTVAVTVAVWAMLLEDASHPDHRGLCARGVCLYAAVLDLEADTVDLILGHMHNAGLIVRKDDYTTITHWNERQFETDAKDPTNADRQRRYRMSRNPNDTKQVRNGSVTETKRPDTDTDTEKRERRASAPVPRKRASRIKSSFPEDYCPNATTERVNAEHGYAPADLAASTVKMKAWALSNGILKADWDATHQNWIRSNAERRGGGPIAPPVNGKPMKFFEVGSPQYEAWRESGHTVGRFRDPDDTSKVGWKFPDEWPPGHAELTG